MGVLDGQAISAAVTNAAFLNKNQADQMTFPMSLTKTLSLSKRDESSAATVNALDSSQSLVNVTGTVTTINGAAAPATYSNGAILVIANSSASSITINHESGSATAGNRFSLPGSTSLTILAGQAAQFYYNSTDSRWKQMSGTGSGSASGSAGINYILNPDATVDTSGYTTYANAAAAQPVSGAGGSPNITWTRTTSAPLRGVAEFLLTKDAVNRQGQGVAYDFTIDNADLARVLTVSFDYEVISGTYATGDLTVYLIQDPTGTPVVIQPAGFQVVAATAGTKMTQIATFQTDATQKSYRLCFHIATTSASAYTLALDNIVLGPTQKVYGAPVTDWISYTPTIGSLTGSVTNATATARYRRIGDSIEGEATITFSGASAAFNSPNITLPSGLFGDTSKIPDSDTDRGIGICSCLDSGTTAYGPWYVGYNHVTNKILATYAPFVNATSASTAEPVKGTNIANNYPFTFGANDKIFISWKLPILGWSSNVEVSSSTDTRVVAATYVNSGGKSIPFNTQTTIDTNWIKLTDTHNAFSNGVFTCPVAGNYVVGARFLLNSALNAANSLFNITAVQAGSATNTINIGTYSCLAATTYYVGTSGAGHVFSCQAGDTITIQCYQVLTAGGRTLHTDSSYNSISISRLSGPAQIAASETVACRFGNFSAPILGNIDNVVLPMPSKIIDTHGSYSSSTGYTVPVSGKYLVIFQYLTQVYATTSLLVGRIQLNGTNVNSATTLSTGTSSQYTVQVTALMNAFAGDIIRPIAFSNAGAPQLSPSFAENNISIVRVGN